MVGAGGCGHGVCSHISSPGQEAQLADHPPWYLHRHAMDIPSLPGQSSEVLCCHLHSHASPHPYHPLPHLPPHFHPPLHCDCPVIYAHRSQSQCCMVHPYHPPCVYPQQNHVLSLIHRLTPQWSCYHHLRILT